MGKPGCSQALPVFSPLALLSVPKLLSVTGKSHATSVISMITNACYLISAGPSGPLRKPRSSEHIFQLFPLFLSPQPTPAPLPTSPSLTRKPRLLTSLPHLPTTPLGWKPSRFSPALSLSCLPPLGGPCPSLGEVPPHPVLEILLPEPYPCLQIFFVSCPGPSPQLINSSIVPSR